MAKKKKFDVQEHLRGWDDRANRRDLPLGIIKAQTHSFAPYIEVFNDQGKIDNVHMIDCRTASAYQFLKNSAGKQAYDPKTGKPVLQQVPLKAVRLSKQADDDLMRDFHLFVKEFLERGVKQNDIYFGVET